MRLERVAGTSVELRDALAEVDLPTDDLSDLGRIFFRFTDSSSTLGFGGLELHGDSALLRSLVVQSGHRGKGWGRIATDMLIHQARASGASTIYLLTTDAAPFFERAGFSAIAREFAPPEILATRQATSLCPSTAALLARKI